MIEGITKKQGNNGAPVYLIDGNEITTYISDFDEILTMELSKIEAMFDVILDLDIDDYLNPNFGYIGKDIISNIENIKSDIYHQSDHRMKVARNSKFEMFPGKKHLRENSIIDVYFEPKKAPETELANKESGA